MIYKNKFLLIFLIILTSLTFFGCKPSTTPRPETKPTKYEQITVSDLRWVIKRENGVDVNAVMPDNYYIVVDEEWFKNEILPGFQAFLFKNGIQSYNNLRNDCDDFARAFSFYVRVKFRTMGYMKATPAVGDIHYSNLETSHAINVGVFFDKFGEKVIRFIEPQKHPAEFVELDEETKKYYIKYLGM